jgi:DNA-binding FadR family transcriptional regulator
MRDPGNRHSYVVEQLARLIMRGAVPADAALPREDELTAQFGLSRTVIREATKTLQAMGLVVTGPRTGTRVQPMHRWRLFDPQVMDWLTDEDLATSFVQDLLDLRFMIEPEAAAFAAERATPEQVLAIMAAAKAMCASQERSHYEAADFVFHEAIFAAAGNMLLSQLTPVMRGVLKASFRHSARGVGQRRESSLVHLRIAKAIAARKPALARDTMIKILRRARTDIEEAARETKAAKRNVSRGSVHVAKRREMAGPGS